MKFCVSEIDSLKIKSFFYKTLLDENGKKKEIGVIGGSISYIFSVKDKEIILDKVKNFNEILELNSKQGINNKIKISFELDKREIKNLNLWKRKNEKEDFILTITPTTIANFLNVQDINGNNSLDITNDNF